MERLAIVVPCYNEEAVLESTNAVLLDVLEQLFQKGLIARDSFLLYVDDGSRDQTWNLVLKCKNNSPYVYGIKLARNAGHQNALVAGLLSAKNTADMIVSIDADLQDDVTVIEEMVKKHKEGNDIVYGVRNDRKTDSFFKRTTAQAFYKVMKLMGIKTIYNHADFRLMSKRALEEFANYQETNLYLRGMVPLLGYQSESVFYERKKRMAGESKYPVYKMFTLAFEGITSFSRRPISFIMVIGILVILCSVIASIYAFISYMCGNVVAGWTSLILSVWFIGGVQLLSIGLIGTYIGKIYMEVKHRPRYNIEIDHLDQTGESMDKNGKSV